MYVFLGLAFSILIYCILCVQLPPWAGTFPEQVRIYSTRGVFVQLGV